MGRSPIWAGLALLLAVGTARGQTSDASPPPAANPPSQPAAAPTDVKPLTVTGKAPAYVRSIDRRSYDLSANPQAAGGPIGEVLRGIPSVDVDPQGKISLRGDTNVTILVDGKPSAVFQGLNRADALLQLPASRYQRVEVMTNPSAAFSPEGSAGIINLVTRKSARALKTVSLTAGVGAPEQYRASVNASYDAGRLSLTGSGGFRRTTWQFDDATMRQITDPASGEMAAVDLAGKNLTAQTSWNASAGAAYQLNGSAKLSTDLGFFSGHGGGDFDTAYRSSATSGVLAEDYESAGSSRFAYRGLYGSSSYLEQLGGEDHQLLVRLNYSGFDVASQNPQSFTFLLPAVADQFQDLAMATSERLVGLTAEFKGPMPGKAKLVAGYDFEVAHDVFDHAGSLGTSETDALADPSLTDHFAYDQITNALYATYQRPMGKLTMMPGLRLEEVSIHTNDAAVGVSNSFSYFEIYPSLHLAFQLGQDSQLTASYSRRVDRPDAQNLDPFRIFNGPLSFSQGNPRLAPSFTDSYEAAYEYNGKASYLLATLYFHDQRDMVSPITESIGGGTVLTTWANVGQSRSAGLELVANRKLFTTVSVSLTGNFYWNQIAAADQGQVEPESGGQFTSHLKVDWNATPKDFIQIAAYAYGTQRTPQGFQSPYATVNLGYRHEFGRRLAADLVVVDPFDSDHQDTVLASPNLRQEEQQRFHARSVYLSLTYALGGAGQKTKDFDFSTGASSPAPH